MKEKKKGSLENNKRTELPGYPPVEKGQAMMLLREINKVQGLTY